MVKYVQALRSAALLVLLVIVCVLPRPVQAGRLDIERPDEQLEAKLGPERVAQICGTLTVKLGEGDVTAALVAGVEALGEVLAALLPGDAGDANEIVDALITIE